MFQFVTTVLWLVLSPLAAVTGVITAVVIFHYTPFYHGSDIILFSYAVAMTINGLLVPSIPALLQITDTTWPDALCQFYVWIFITFRVLQALTLVCLSILWSTIMKYSTTGKRVQLTAIVKGVIPSVWTISAVVGLLPIIGAVPQDFHKEGKCSFLCSDLGPGLGVAMGVLVFSCVVLSVICVCDATVLLKYVRRVALVKYGAGRFHLPQKRSSVPGAGTYTIHERYHQLTFAWDVCRLVLVWVIVSGLMSHIPYAVLEFVALTSPSGTPSKGVETAVIWLVLIESLCLPHLLWIVSTRYRHALVYIWRVRVLRKPAMEEEDAASCTLKSYLRTAQHLNGTSNRSGPSGSLPRQREDDEMGVRPSDTSQLPLANCSSLSREQSLQYQRNSYKSPDLESGACVVTTGPWHQQNYQQSANIPSSHRHSSTRSSLSSPSNHKHRPSSVHVHMQQQGGQISYLDTKNIELTRSASSSSRHEWKEQMRKKHLPPIFVNEAFDSGESSRVRMIHPVSAPTHAREDSNNLHFYLSGDYHPDNLNTDSLPRKRHLLEERSESEGASGQYDENDIESILDHSYTVQTNANVHSTRPHLSSFRAVQTNKESNSVNMPLGVDENLSNSNLPDVISTGRKSTECSDYENERLQLQEAISAHVRNASDSSYVTSNVSDSKGMFDDVDVADILEDYSGRTSDICRTDGDGDADASTDLYHAEELSLQLSYSEPNKLMGVIPPYPQPDGEESTTNVHNGVESDAMNFENNFLYRRHSDDSSSRTSIDISQDDKHIRNFEYSGLLTSSFQGGASNRVSAEFGHRYGVDSPRSNISTPVSFSFDDDTDRGFEEALSVGYPGTPSICGTGPGFDSVTEESEDGSSVFPIDCSVPLEEDPFRTQAVVSKTLSDSRSSGSNDSPFDNTPPVQIDNRCQNRYSEVTDKVGNSPVSDIMVNSTSEVDHGDSGFNSGLDSSVVMHQGSSMTLTSSPHNATPTRQSGSPWPQEVSTWPEGSASERGHFFENDFSSTVPLDSNSRSVHDSNSGDTQPVYF